MAEEPILSLKKVSKSFDGVGAVSEVTFSIFAGEVIGLLGPNGAGKTTLFNIITSYLAPDSGRIVFRGVDLQNLSPDQVVTLGIARTFQQLRLIRSLTVIENILLAFKNQPGENLNNLFFRSKLSKAREIRNREIAVKMLEEMGLGNKLHDLANNLSYGQQKLLSLVCCLATGADLLLLDEPIAGLSSAMIDRILPLLRGLPEQGKSVLLIEHNVDVMMEMCDRFMFMDAGTLVTQGTPEQVRSDPRVIAAYLR